MKKFLISILALVLCICTLTACGTVEPIETEAPTAAPIPTAAPTEETEPSGRYTKIGRWLITKEDAYFIFIENTKQPLLDFLNK